MWHIDSYDKLKPYGIAINGCIDGFSRYIIWMHANYTASDPKVVGGYFMNAVSDLGGCPKTVRGDRGTENRYVEQFQCFFDELNENEDNDQIRFMYGRSTANQRLESWWSIFRKQLMEFWISLFHQLAGSGHFNGEKIEKELIRFYFLDLIQVRFVTILF